MKLFGKKNNDKPTRQPGLMAGQDSYTFRRSRTLTGSTSPLVTSSAEARSQLKTDRLKVHELHQQRRRMLRSFVIVLFCAGILTLLLASHFGPIAIEYPQAKAGITKPDTAKYERTIRDYLNLHPMEQFSFSVNSEGLGDYLRQQHSEVADARVSRSELGFRAEFEVLLRKPLLAWSTPQGQLFVDETGTAFNLNYFEHSLVQVVDRSGVTPDANGTIASKRFIRFLGQLVAAINTGDKGKVNSVIIPASTRQIDLRLEGRNYDIKTHIDRDPHQQAEDLLNTLGYIDKKGIKPQYIDLRVAGKAFYKE